MPTFTIEPYQQSDLASLVQFVSHLQDHEAKREPDLRPGEDIGEEYALSLLGRAAGDNGTILVARAGDEVLGFISVWKDRDDDLLLREAARSHAYISDLFVVEGMRGKGIARALLAAAESAMQAKGCRRIRVCAKATNPEAVRFYGRLGYRPYEIVYSKLLQADKKNR